MSTIGQIFRVFLSSTFVDFQAERHALTPLWSEIQDYCRERGARFQIIDLRWGISDEAAQDQRTVPVGVVSGRRQRSAGGGVCPVAARRGSRGRALPIRRL